MAFNFSVNAQNPMIGVLFVKIGVQLQLLIVLIGYSGELIQYGIGQLTKCGFIGIQFLSHFGKDIYQPCSASRVIDTHKVRFIAGIV